MPAFDLVIFETATFELNKMDTVPVPIQLPNLPEDYPDYSSLEYWTSRHQMELKEVESSSLTDMMMHVQEEWYLNIDELLKAMFKVQNFFDESHYQLSDAEICILGTGFSDISAQLVSRGFSNIVNIDYSQPSMDFQNSLRDQSSDKDYAESVDFICKDIRDSERLMEQQDDFRLVIDKACLDCVACSSNLGDMCIAVENVHRILESGGSYLLVSRAGPLSRLWLFQTTEN